MDLMKLKESYLRHYKKLMLIPLLMLLAAFFIIGIQYQKTGDIMIKDVSLKGGMTATIETEQAVDAAALEAAIAQDLGDSSVRRLTEFGTDAQRGILIETESTDEPTLRSLVQETTGITLTQENYSVQISGSSLGESFYRQMLGALVFSFILMGIVVFIIYRKFVPSVAVIGAAFTDIVVALAIANLVGLRISTAGISALLLLIGYSVDSDILQTTRMLKRSEGTVVERMFSSMKTGLTMTITSIIAVLIGYFVSSSIVIKEMFFIISVGLIADIIYTYLMNSALLLWYTEKKHL